MRHRRVLVLSVRHTGTRLLVRHILAPHYREIPITTHNPKVRQDGCIQAHPSDRWVPVIPRDVFTIVPVRDWSAVEASWRRQGEDLNELAQQRRNLSLFRHDFRLSIDGPERDEQLDELERLLDLPLDHSWPVVGASASPVDALTSAGA